ncbi:MAG TPA: NAD-dependent epimerase/dehydratase family protein [Kofleriaceae bacterium]|nr:NAD-dependent epimerase/dehydratase family protein [Kofleriaceae bacterium]
MKRAFVTGGSGFVGGRVIQELRARGVEVAALARSAASAATVEALGATSVRGDLDDPAAMQAGMAGADVVIHAAAYVAEHGPLAEFLRVTVTGTENALAAARAAGVPRFVHVSTEAVLADGKPIVRADETRPRTTRPAGPYPLSKGLAEERVLAANRDGLATVIVRPRFIWGAGDTSLIPKIAALVKRGRFAWIGGGRHLSSTCHVDNVVEGVLLAAERGKPGEIYFLTDGEPVEFRAFLTQLLATYGAEPGDRSVPLWLARSLAALTGWMQHPPVTRTAVALIGQEVTVVDDKARRELGYTSHMSRERGLAELRGA